MELAARGGHPFPHADQTQPRTGGPDAGGPDGGGSDSALAVVAWTVVANSARTHTAYQHALAVGFDRAFLVAAGIALFILVIAILPRSAGRGGAGRTSAAPG